MLKGKASRSRDSERLANGMLTSFGGIGRLFPIETLQWHKIILVRLFAPKEFEHQRQGLQLVYGQLCHELFAKALAMHQQGLSAVPEICGLLVMSRASGTDYGLKRRFLMGRENLGALRLTIRNQYAPELLRALDAKASEFKIQMPIDAYLWTVNVLRRF